MIVRGSANETAARVEAELSSLPDRAVVWIGASAPSRAFERVDPRELARRLGGAWDVVVSTPTRASTPTRSGRLTG
jgi:hypothetical protein